MTDDDDLLASATAAVRISGSEDAGPLADATRERLVRSLEVHHRRHGQLMGAVTVAVVLLGGTVSWALSTGRIQALFSPPPAPPAKVEPAPEQVKPPARRRQPAPRPSELHAVPEAPPEPLEVPAPPPLPEPAPEPPPVRRAAGPPPRPEVEAMYRRAHELHFRGADHGAALAAWDAYLAAEPTGRFAAEARFNRGLVLIRLGRHHDAIIALSPFARGEVAAGYRREDATRLVERLEQLAAP